jgi:hypothetical protein
MANYTRITKELSSNYTKLPVSITGILSDDNQTLNTGNGTFVIHNCPTFGAFENTRYVEIRGIMQQDGSIDAEDGNQIKGDKIDLEMLNKAINMIAQLNA